MSSVKLKVILQVGIFCACICLVGYIDGCLVIWLSIWSIAWFSGFPAFQMGGWVDSWWVGWLGALLGSFPNLLFCAWFSIWLDSCLSGCPTFFLSIFPTGLSSYISSMDNLVFCFRSSIPDIG